MNSTKFDPDFGIEEQCYDCARKHLGTAHAYFLEASSGRYPAHFWLGIGELVLAASHVRRIKPDLAITIDKEKQHALEDPNYWINVRPILSLIELLVINHNKKEAV